MNTQYPWQARPVGLLLIVGLTLLASSCGATGTPTSNPTLGDSPVDQLLGVPITDDAAMVAYERQVAVEAEHLIAECMLAEGFDYVPRDPEEFGLVPELAESSREFAKQEGFGLANLVEDELLLVEEPPEDPNVAIIESLTATELAAYDSALYGDGADETDFGGGCQGRAYGEAYEVLAVLDGFGQELDALFAEFMSDPRMVAIGDEWARCMAQAGYDYGSQQAMYQAVADRVSEITRDESSYDDPERAADAISRQDINGVVIEVRVGSDLTAAARAALDDVVADERAIALASWDCREPHRRTELEVQQEYEQRFVDQSGDAIRRQLGE